MKKSEVIDISVITPPLTYAKMSELACVAVVEMDKHQYHKELCQQGWVRLAHRCIDSDYQVIAYINEKRRETVIVHRGMPIGCSGFETLKRYVLALIKNKLHCHIDSELDDDFHRVIVKHVKKGYVLTHTGHSLGGFLATVSLYLNQRKDIGRYFYPNSRAIVFDPLGSLPFLEEIEPNVAAHGIGQTGLQDLDITHYVSWPNFINCFSKHAGGTLYHLRSPALKNLVADYNLIEYQLETNRLESIIKSFDPDTGWMRSGCCDMMGDWPLIDLEPLKSVLQGSGVHGKAFRLLQGWVKHRLLDENGGISYPQMLLGGLEYQSARVQSIGNLEKKSSQDALKGRYIESHYDARYSKRLVHFCFGSKDFLVDYARNIRGSDFFENSWERKFKITPEEKELLLNYSVNDNNWLTVKNRSVLGFQKKIYDLIGERDQVFLDVNGFCKENASDAMKRSSYSSFVEGACNVGVPSFHLRDNHYLKELELLSENSRVLCVHGLSGSGKTVLARQYMKKTFLHSSLCLEINAKTDETLSLGLRELYKTVVGRDDMKNMRDDKDGVLLQRRCLSDLSRQLQVGPLAGGVLLLDNVVANGGLLGDILNHLEGVTIIITTQNSGLLSNYPGLARLSLNQGWSLEDGVRFFEEVDSFSTELERQKLAGYLRFPLGMSVAAVTIRNERLIDPEYGCRKYLEELLAGVVGEKEEAALRSGAISSDILQARQTVVLRKAVEKALEKSEASLIQFLGYLAPLPIPFPLVRYYCYRFNIGNDRLLLSIDSMREYSLLDTCLQDGVIVSVEIPALVQDVIKKACPLEESEKVLLGQYRSEERIKATVKIVVEACEVDREQLVFSSYRCFLAAMVAHAGHVLLSLSDSYSRSPLLGRAWERLGSAWRHLGAFLGYKECTEVALDILKAEYGAGHLEVARIEISLASAYHSLGDLSTARELEENVFSILSRYRGSRRHEYEISVVLNNLGSTHLALCDFTRAKILLEQSLDIKKGLFAVDDVEIALAKCNLGAVYTMLGYLAKGMEYLVFSLSILQDHGDVYSDIVFKAMTNLGLNYRISGKPLEGVKLLEQALEASYKRYGLNHIESAKVLKIMGSACVDLGDISKGVSLLWLSKRIVEDGYGINHILTAEICNEMGNVYRDLGCLLKGKELLDQSLSVLEKNYGLAGVELVVALNDLGSICRDLGDQKSARKHLDRSLMIAEKELGPRHMLFMEAAFTLSTLGKHDNV